MEDWREIWQQRGRGHAWTGAELLYWPLRVFSFLNLSPSAASILYGLDGGGAKPGPLNGSLNTGPVMQTQTDCQTDMMGTGAEVGRLLAQNNSDPVVNNNNNTF